MYNPDDILSLSKYNSGELDNYAEMPIEDLDLDDNSPIKRVSLDELEDPYRYLN